MNPAPSVIVFTTVSGLGYGMLFVLALCGLAGVIPSDRWFGLAGLALSLGFVASGLLASTAHLGRPERIWLAISQWRTSWLSREGLAALLTFLPALLLGIGWVFWQSLSGAVALMAVASAFGAAATVYCTGMIYASLRPVAAWHQPLTAPVYLGFALMSGALGVHALLALFGVERMAIGVLALAATAFAFGLKIACWRSIARQKPAATPGSATGLGHLGRVRPLDPPHTQTNYLLHEMGFRLGRRHARRLRQLTYLFGLFGPLIATLLALVVDRWPAVVLTLTALCLGMVGVLLERWLFFAEAEHTVMLYYGDGAG